MAFQRNCACFNVLEFRKNHVFLPGKLSKDTKMKNALYLTFFIFILANTGFSQQLTETQVVALTILGEARGEGEAGMYGVACVVIQRSINRNLSPKQVCLEEDQFDCWKKMDYNLLKIPQAAYAWRLASNLKRLDRTFVKNADHFCHINEHNYWTRTSKPEKNKKNHKFYKLRP